MKSHHGLQSSILDRLIEDPEGQLGGSVQSLRAGISQLKRQVVRDLENLLNTRRNILPPPQECPELSRSLFVYGLKDFTAENPASLLVRQQLRQDIERTVAQFEPRLKNVRVALDQEGGNERRLRFRINGLLVVEPISEPISFDTFFEMNRGLCTISE